MEGEQEKFVELEHCACRIYNVPVLLKETLSPLILPSVQPSPGNHQISVDRAMGLLLWANFILQEVNTSNKNHVVNNILYSKQWILSTEVNKGDPKCRGKQIRFRLHYYTPVKEAISLLMLCLPMLIFTVNLAAQLF